MQRVNSVDSGAAEENRLSMWNQIRLPILGGRLRGHYWLPASRGKLLRIFLGTYEREQTGRFLRHIRAGDVVFDVGAAVGYYTLLSSLLVGDQGRVVAFEPAPRNVAFLRHHLRINRLGNATVHQSAVGSRSGRVRFSMRRGTGTGRIDQMGNTTVSVCRLDDMLAREPRMPTHVKIDVEGAELQVLQGAKSLLRRHRPMIFLSTHGPHLHGLCCEWLTEMEYQIEPVNGPSLDTASEILCRAA